MTELEKLTEQVNVVTGYVDALLVEVRELRKRAAVLDTPVMCGIDQPRVERSAPEREAHAPYVVWDEAMYEPDEAIALGAALIRAGLEAGGGK